ncbi:MAG TPA: outer membrane lipoprotein carrier protein LolA [Vicinamibacterales bacterium]|jgi:outer membrane lipoprotein-sorting protein
MRILAISLITVALSVCLASGGQDLFDDLHARGRIMEAKIQTISARFTETTVSSLLAKPLVAKGTLIAAKPPRLLLKYMSPERKTLLMDGNRLVVFWHDRGETEKLDITEIMKRVNQYFTNADASQVRRAFDVRAFPDTEFSNAYQLDMVPRRKQIKQGLQRLQIWIDRDSLLLRQMKMSFPGGDSDTIRIDDITLNTPLAPNAFEVAK